MKIVAVLMIGLITQGQSQLHCYVCENCWDGSALTDNMLQRCDGEVDDTTEATTPTTVPTVTVPTDETATATSSSSEPPTEPSTDPSIVPSTDPSTDPTTDPSTELSTASSSESSSEPPTEQSIDPTSSISTITTPETPINTTPPPEPGAESTFTASPDPTTATVPESLPTTTSQQPETPTIVIAFALSKQIEYNCFVLTKEVNGIPQVNRGCVIASPNINDMCARANNNTTPKGCSTCATNQCNSGSGIIISVILILCSIFILVTV